MVTQGHGKLYHSIRPHDFLLMFHSNHWTISYRFRHKRRFSPKIANCSHPVYLTPRWKGSPWNWVSAQGSE